MSPRRLVALSGVKEDLRSLPSRRLQEIALAKIAGIRAGRLVGRPLGRQARTGDLGDCRKVYFDERADRAPAWRIVYREREDGGVEVVKVIAVGARADAAAYLTAGARLGRRPDAPEGT